MLTSTWSMFDRAGSHVSEPLPFHVCRRLRHTLPFSYRFGFARNPNEV